MTDDSTRLTRRTALKGLGGAAAGLGGAALLASTGAAAANNFTIQNTSVSNDDGQIGYVGVDVGGNIVWDGFDVPVERLEFTSEVRIPAASTGWHTLQNTLSDTFGNWSGDGDSNGWGGGGEYVVSDNGTSGEVVTDAQWIVIWDGSATVPDGYRTSGLTIPDWTAEVSVDADDTTEPTTIEKRSTVHFCDADGTRLSSLPSDVQPAQATATFDVTVTNEDSTTSGTTDGSSTAG